MKRFASLLAGLGLAGGMAVSGATPAQALAYEIYNSAASAYAINVYTDGSCSQGRKIIYQGRTSGQGYASYRVNAPSKWGTQGYGYTQSEPANRCVPYGRTSYYATRMDVRVYSNA